MSLEGFANHVRGIQVGSEAFNTFLSSTENKEALQRYAQSVGCPLTPQEQDQILSMRATIYAAAQESKARALPDAALDAVTGGSAAAWGAVAAGVLGVAGGIAAVALSPIAVGFAVGAVIVGGATGIAAAVGTGIGAIVDALS